MTPRHTYISLIFTFIALCSQIVLAEPILEEGDWTLDEITTSFGTQCVASNRDSSWFRSEVYYLEISKLKNKLNSPVEFTLRVDDNKRGNLGFTASIKGASTDFTFVPLNDNKKQQVFMGIGSNLSQFINLLTANNDDIEITGSGGNSTSEFSNDGDGFKEIMSEMEKRCNNNTKLVDTKFENFFLQSIPKNLNPLKISITTAQQLRKFYFFAFDLFAQGKETQMALDALIAKYQPAINELETVRKNLNQIQNIDLPNTRQTLSDAQKQQHDATAEITRLIALIPSLTHQVSISQKAFDDASAILAPHVPEHNRITNRLDNAQSSLSELRQRYASIESRLQTLASQVSQLDSEADRLESSLPRQRSELSDLTSSLRDAERRRSQYNVSYERDRRIERDSDHRRLQDERSRLNSHLSEADRNLSQIRGERERIKRELEQCKAVTPPKDCTNIARALEVAASQIAESERLRSEISSRLDQTISRLSEIESRIDRQVRGEYETLTHREEEIRTQRDRVDDLVRRDERRLVQIRSIEIPQMEREQSQLLSERPQVSSRIRELNDNIDRISQDLENFERVTDWDRKAAEVYRTERKLDADQANLKAAHSKKVIAEKNLENGRAVERQSKERINSLLTRSAELGQRALDLENAIKPLVEQRAPFDRKIKELGEAVSNLRISFLDLLN